MARRAKRSGPTRGVYAAHGMQSNYCMVIHTLYNGDRVELPANMVVVRLAHGVAADGRHSTPGDLHPKNTVVSSRCSGQPFSKEKTLNPTKMPGPTSMCSRPRFSSLRDGARPGRQRPDACTRDNPRYLTDDSGRAIYLTGPHTWLNLQDGGLGYPPEPLNYDAYLDLHQRNHHNFIRLWTWESAAWVRPDTSKIWLDPLPFARTGPGVAADGRPKFDLTKLNPAYFDRFENVSRRPTSEISLSA